MEPFFRCAHLCVVFSYRPPYRRKEEKSGFSNDDRVPHKSFHLRFARFAGNCYGCYHPERRLIESGPVTFSMWLDKMDGRPYRMEVQLY